MGSDTVFKEFEQVYVKTENGKAVNMRGIIVDAQVLEDGCDKYIVEGDDRDETGGYPIFYCSNKDLSHVDRL